MSAKDIAQSFGFAHTTILRWMIKFGISRRPSGARKGEKNKQWKGGPRAYGERRRKTREYKIYQKKWREEHPNHMTKRCREMKQKAIEYKGGKCLSCDIKFDGTNACIFDFHHKDASKKDISIGRVITRKWEKVKPELDKTEMLCSNCHRLKHNGG